MISHYKLPMQLFIIFQHVDPIVYTHDSLSSNHYVIIIPNQYIYNFSSVLKNEVFFNTNYLAEISAIDTLKFSKFIPEVDLFFSKNRIIIFYIFYMYFLKIRLSFFTFFNNSDLNICSIEQNYSNAMWLEREVSEMFQINFTLKKDNRNLLLDYTQNEHPMLKDFPCEGYKDLYYDFIEENLVYVDHNYIEL